MKIKGYTGAPDFLRGNFLTQRLASSGILSENDGATVQATYTVAAGKRAALGGAFASITGQVGASSTTSTDEVFAECRIAPSGSGAAAFIRAEFNVDAYAAGARDSNAMGAGIHLAAGDTVDIRTRFNGTSGGAGRVNHIAAAILHEFDV
jgi:hypothetical protein